MALVGNMTIEELALFYFQKENQPRFSPYFEIEQINIVAPYHTSQQPRFDHKHLLPAKFYFRLLSSKYTNKFKKA
jgi:hypothetical protein